MGVYSNFTTFDPRFLSTSALGGFSLGATNNHRMAIADNGFMYIIDGYDVHKFDGTESSGISGRAYPSVLTFPEPYQLVDATDGRGFLWIGVTGTTRNLTGSDNQQSIENLCGVYVWDRLSSRVNTTDFIFLSGAKEIRKVFFLGE